MENIGQSLIKGSMDDLQKKKDLIEIFFHNMKKKTKNSLLSISSHNAIQTYN